MTGLRFWLRNVQKTLTVKTGYWSRFCLNIMDPEVIMQTLFVGYVPYCIVYGDSIIGRGRRLQNDEWSPVLQWFEARAWCESFLEEDYNPNVKLIVGFDENGDFIYAD